MRRCLILLFLGLLPSWSFAELTLDQKVADFQAVAALYAKRYAPYEWKRAAFGFDLMDTAPWLAQVRATTNDRDFYEIMVSYVASLNDAHDYYYLPYVTFAAQLNFSVDIYDGLLLVDSINRAPLPASQFPFDILRTLGAGEPERNSLLSNRQCRAGREWQRLCAG